MLFHVELVEFCYETTRLDDVLVMEWVIQCLLETSGSSHLIELGYEAIPIMTWCFGSETTTQCNTSPHCIFATNFTPPPFTAAVQKAVEKSCESNSQDYSDVSA